LKSTRRTCARTDEDRRLREVRVDELLEKIGSGPQQLWALNPYVGCLIGCAYCYAQEGVGQVRGALGVSTRRWGSYVDVRMNAAEVLAREITSYEPLPIKFAPITTDPYQAVESKYEITRQCLTVLRDHPYTGPVLLLTRSALVRRDVALLAELQRAVVGVSLPSDDEVVLSHFEPRASSASERFETLRIFKAAGIATTVVIEPILPCDTERFADSLARYADSVRVAPLQGVYGAGSLFADPRYSACKDDAWQAEHIARLESALHTRGVPVWKDEFPPQVKTWLSAQ
jgi:DNA repair photolyase